MWESTIEIPQAQFIELLRNFIQFSKPQVSLLSSEVYYVV